MKKIVITPRKFEMGQYTYSVKSGKKHDEDLQSRSLYGDHSGHRKHIRVDSSLSADQKHSTFIHEMIEAVNCGWCNYKINHDNITNIANGLSQAFKSMGIVFDIKEND